MLLFDLTSCQPEGNTVNHGGKEYAEAVFSEMMRRGVHLSGVYNSREYLNPEFADYCKNHGELIDINEYPLQEIINSNKYKSFYSAIPYGYHSINFGTTTFIGNLHGLRNVEAFTDEYEYLYSLTLKQKLFAFAKRFKIIRRHYIKKYLTQTEQIINKPSFICITGSVHSKYFLKSKFTTIDSNKIAVFYDPLNIRKVDNDNNNQYGKYYLIVSSNRWVKNSYRGIMALDELISAGLITCKVIVTGFVNGLSYYKKIKNKNSFIFKDYVTSEELSVLYKNAYSLIFLSLSEGFGYPPLEAISRNVPVICSPLTSIYEIYQAGVLYCNPFSIDDIKTKILMMEDDNIHRQYIDQGHVRAQEIIRCQNEDLPKLVDYILSF